MEDSLKLGEYYTADFIRASNLDASNSFKMLFKLVIVRSKGAQDSGVKNTGAEDTSPVFLVSEINPDVTFKSAEYAADQSSVEFLPAPGEGKRYVAIYASIRTSANSGVAYFSVNGATFGKLYISSKSDFGATDVHVHAPENTAVLFTSTQGANPIFVSIGYYVENI